MKLRRVDNGSNGEGFPEFITVTRRNLVTFLTTQESVHTANRQRCPLALCIKTILHHQYTVEVDGDCVRLIDAQRHSQDYPLPGWAESFLEALDAKKHHFLERAAPILTPRQTMNRIPK